MNIHILKINLRDNSKLSFLHMGKVLIEFKEEHHDELRKFSLVLLQNKLLTITYEHLYSVGHFERIFQANIYPSDQNFEKREQ